MRDLRPIFEWLGLIEPDRSRHEPVALPAWTVPAVAAAGALAFGVVGVLALFTVRLLLG